MRLLSLCSGYGGLDLAVEDALGAETVAYAELDTKAAAVFARHWLGVPNLGDLTAADWTAWAGRVDVVTAGFPCQDLSYAGKGAGIVKGNRSGTWYAIEDAVGALRPRLVVLENVAAIVGRRPGLDVVLAGLARLGFDAEWTCLRAADVGAPHGRKRWFCIAHAAGEPRPWDGHPQPADRPPAPARAGQEEPRRRRSTATDPGGERHGQGLHPRGVGRLDRADAGAPRERERARQEPGDRGATAPTHANGGRREERVQLDGDQAPAAADGRPCGGHADRHRPQAQWGDYAPAIDRWAAIIGRPAPPPTDERGRLSPLFVEWMMGLPAGWVTDAPGLSRADMLKILGNGVVPQQAAAALRALL